jgi:hypothetical protein
LTGARRVVRHRHVRAGGEGQPGDRELGQLQHLRHLVRTEFLPGERHRGLFAFRHGLDFPNPDYFQEVAVMGIGASAEYTGFQGGVINVVTKSGSNDLHGTTSFYNIPSGGVANNGYPSPSAPWPYSIEYSYDFSQQLGGPIKRDRIWFYLTMPVTRRKGSNIGVDPIFATKTRTFKPYGKISIRPSNNDFLVQNLAPGNTTSSTYRYNPATRAYDILLSRTDPRANLAIDPDLTNQYTDQLSVGIERELMTNLGVNVSFIYKRERNLIGSRDPLTQYGNPVTVIDTFEGQTQTFQVYNRITPASVNLNMTANRPDSYQNYRSVVFQAHKRFSQHWSLQSSYQWQRQTGITTSDNPNAMINAFERASTDSTHAIKASATFELPYGVNLGVRESYETGRPIPRTITVRGFTQGNVNITAAARGVYLLPALNDLQFRLDKDFRFSGRQRLRLSVDLFNVFNVDTPINVQQNSTQTLAFLTPTDIFLPRRAQIGVRYEF